MADFEPAINITLENEGGLVNNPSDPGGITNHGISLKFLRTLRTNATPDDIRFMTVDEAKQIYLNEFWLKNDYGKIVDQLLANQIFDLCVNIGASMANSCLQRAVNNAADKAAISVDGNIGLRTLDAVNSARPTLLRSCLRIEAANYYKNLVKNNPKLNIFLKGWMNRCYSF